MTATESGYGRDQSAIVSYRSKPDGPESFVRSTNYQYIGVKGSGELAEAHNTFLKEWGVFVGLSAGTVKRRRFRDRIANAHSQAPFSCQPFIGFLWLDRTIGELKLEVICIRK